MLLIGLTGSIGSGKTMAAHYFEKLNVPVVDADHIAKILCNQNEEAFQKIREKFGDMILDQKGQLNRRKLREIIFQNVDKKKWLENLLHPLIIDEILKWTQNIVAPYGVVVAPLLLETPLKNEVDRILVIDCDEKIILKRVSQRDETDESQINKILSQQYSRQERLSYANEVVVNEGSLEELYVKIDFLNQFYHRLSDIKISMPDKLKNKPKGIS